jgi:hypothetical protein
MMSFWFVLLQIKLIIFCLGENCIFFLFGCGIPFMMSATIFSV